MNNIGVYEVPVHKGITGLGFGVVDFEGSFSDIKDELTKLIETDPAITRISCTFNSYQPSNDELQLLAEKSIFPREAFICLLTIILFKGENFDKKRYCVDYNNSLLVEWPSDSK